MAPSTITSAAPAIPAEAADAVAPTRPDGTAYRYELVYGGGTRRTYADTLDALMDVLIPGYLDMSDEQQWQARLAFLVRAQVLIQSELNLDPRLGSLAHAEQVILQGPRHAPPVVATWDCPVPLVLISTYYEPAGVIPRPVRAAGMAANIIWLDPSDDQTFLTSLHDTAVVSWHVAQQN